MQEKQISTPKEKKDPTGQIQKPPVVVVMGHIDHGKTSLLLSIRKLNVPEGKPGGVITQHIGAFEVEKNGKKITFIDTPGHEAFSQLRSRGAKVADIAVLVVAADEGVKQQTKEAINHIKEAKIPFLVAINKIDKIAVDPEKAERELFKEGVELETMGGKIPVVKVSAKTGKGIDDLLEVILLLSELDGLTTNLQENPEGVILESYLDSKRGPSATLILNKGKIKIGDILGTKSAVCKIKILENFLEEPIKEAFPSQPVTVIGFETPPKSGEIFRKFQNIDDAKANVETKKEKVEFISLQPKVAQKYLNIIVKADVIGSLEAIQKVMEEFQQNKVIVPKIVKAEVGDINQSDVKFASQTKALIIGFRVKINSAASSALKHEKIKVEQFEVIYDLVESIRYHLIKRVEPKLVRENLGKMKALIVFMTEKNRQIVGGKIIEGKIKKGTLIEVLKDNKVIGKGKIINLQKNKRDIQEAGKGEEVGILYEGNQKIEVGNILVIYTEEKKKEIV